MFITHFWIFYTKSSVVPKFPLLKLHVSSIFECLLVIFQSSSNSSVCPFWIILYDYRCEKGQLSDVGLVFPAFLWQCAINWTTSASTSGPYTTFVLILRSWVHIFQFFQGCFVEHRSQLVDLFAVYSLCNPFSGKNGFVAVLKSSCCITWPG